MQNPAYCTADRDAFMYFSSVNSDICFDEKDCSGRFGLLAYNKRDYKKKNAPRRPAEQWIVAIGKHSGLISGRRWSEVQKIIEDNIPTGKKPAKMHNGYSLLSGLIVCEKCGSRMFAKPRSVLSSNGRLYDYICGSKLKGGTKLCSCQNLTGMQTDELVCRSISGYLKESPRILVLLEKLVRDIRSAENENPSEAIEAAIKKLSDDADNLICALSHGDLSPAFVQKVNARIAEIDSEIKKLECKKSGLEAEADRLGQTDTAEIIAEELFDMKKIFSEPGVLSVYEKRSIVRLLVKRIYWDGENMRICIGVK